MPLYIKTERFTDKTLKLVPKVRKEYLEKHRSWVKKLSMAGEKLSSGYLISKKNEPGGGGLLIIEASSFDEAQSLISQDPMITNNLVDWELHEWIPVAGKLLNCNQRG